MGLWVEECVSLSDIRKQSPRAFSSILRRYDPHATQFIAFNQISDFIASLDPPLGISKPNIVALVSFNLPIARGNKIHCLDILHALVKHVLGHVDETDEFKKVTTQYKRLSRAFDDSIFNGAIFKFPHSAPRSNGREV